MRKDIDFMIGNCFNFTAALHRTFGYPLCILYGERIEDGEDLFICIHSVAIKGSTSLDIEGVKAEPSVLLEEYKVEALMSEPYTFTDYFEFENEADFWEEINRCGGTKSETNIEVATDYIKENLTKFK
jgi:hypothetical protein